MARIETDPNYNAPTFSRATAPTDIFKKEDVQNVAAAFSTHTHDGSGKGLAVAFTGVPPGSIPGTALADGAVTSVKIADGTIATVDIANGAVTNAKLASDTDRTNLLTNGGFEVWQRGSGPFAMAQFCADRWKIDGSAGDTVSVSRDTTNVDTGSSVCAAVTLTKGSGTTLIQQQLAPESTSLIGRVVSFSIRVRTSTANAVHVGIYNGSVWTFSPYHTGGGAYQTLSVAGMTLGGSMTQVGIWFDASCTAYLDNAMLVVGTQLADYAPMHPADDLARCLRYYETTLFGSNAYIGTSQAYASNQTVGTFPFVAKKAIQPTITFSPVATFSVTTAGFLLQTATTISATTISTDGKILGYGANCAGTPLTAGNASILISTTGQNSSITSEANP